MQRFNHSIWVVVLLIAGFLAIGEIQAQKAPSTTYTLGPNTPENDLIKLRYAMEQASTIKEKKTLLQKIGETGTFQAMMYAGNLMNDAQLQKSAATAVTIIATTHPEYNGTITRSLLRKAQLYVSFYLSNKIKEYLSNNSQEEIGFVSMFNGKDLSGWKGLVENPIKRAQMTYAEMQKAQAKADEVMRNDWKVEDGMMTYVGHGYDNICTEAKYGDFEMYVDWLLDPNGKEPDAGIYLRGTPQVQIWDTARVNVGAQVGSGGLYNNKKFESKPTEVTDNMTGIWNSFHIIMIGDKVTVYLNGKKVVDNVTMENYWDRNQGIFPVEQIELQAHGSKVYYRDLYIKRLN